MRGGGGGGEGVWEEIYSREGVAGCLGKLAQGCSGRGGHLQVGSRLLSISDPVI